VFHCIVISSIYLIEQVGRLFLGENSLARLGTGFFFLFLFFSSIYSFLLSVEPPLLGEIPSVRMQEWRD
jgi:hypothetical protein